MKRGYLGDGSFWRTGSFSRPLTLHQRPLRNNSEAKRCLSMIITVVLRSGEGSYRFEKSEQHVGSPSTSAKGAEYKSQGERAEMRESSRPWLRRVIGREH